MECCLQLHLVVIFDYFFLNIFTTSFVVLPNDILVFHDTSYGSISVA